MTFSSTTKSPWAKQRKESAGAINERAAPSRPVRGLNLMRASNVTPKKVARVWNGRFFRGKIGFIAGEPGLGKSLVAIYMAATVSTGGAWRGGGTARAGDVLYVTAEDGAADTIRPRLEAAGADLDRVHLIETVTDFRGPRPFSLIADLERLDECLDGLRKPALVIIDPANACLNATDGRSFNPNSISQVRALLGRVEAVAANHDVAIVCLSHFTKAKSGSALTRVVGSLAFVAAARSVFTVMLKQDDPNMRVFAPLKNNLGPDVGALEFRVEQRTTAGKIKAACAVFPQG